MQLPSARLVVKAHRYWVSMGIGESDDCRKRSLGSDASQHSATESFDAAFTQGRVEYLTFGELVACVPQEQADAWRTIIARSAESQKLDESD